MSLQSSYIVGEHTINMGPDEYCWEILDKDGRFVDAAIFHRTPPTVVELFDWALSRIPSVAVSRVLN